MAEALKLPKDWFVPFLRPARNKPCGQPIYSATGGVPQTDQLREALKQTKGYDRISEDNVDTA